jgi:hypothetical protein
MIHGMIDFLAASKTPDYEMTEEIKGLLMKVSAAQADILLKPFRKALEIKGISTTRTVQTPLRSQIPVRTHFDRDTVKPGKFAFDTVAHCGGSARGQFCKTLTGTDVFSGWIEERSLLNAANIWVQHAIANIEAELPFPITGAHYDNGMEFMNEPLLKWCIEQHIEATRTRPYHKNEKPWGTSDSILPKNVTPWPRCTAGYAPCIIIGCRLFALSRRKSRPTAVIKKSTKNNPGHRISA